MFVHFHPKHEPTVQVNYKSLPVRLNEKNSWNSSYREVMRDYKTSNERLQPLRGCAPTQSSDLWRDYLSLSNKKEKIEEKQQQKEWSGERYFEA